MADLPPVRRIIKHGYAITLELIGNRSVREKPQVLAPSHCHGATNWLQTFAMSDLPPVRRIIKHGYAITLELIGNRSVRENPQVLGAEAEENAGSISASLKMKPSERFSVARLRLYDPKSTCNTREENLTCSSFIVSCHICDDELNMHLPSKTIHWPGPSVIIEADGGEKSSYVIAIIIILPMRYASYDALDFKYFVYPYSPPLLS